MNQVQVHGQREGVLKVDSVKGHTSPSPGNTPLNQTRQHLAPPVFPHIPPPSKTPSPDFSRHSQASGFSLHSTVEDSLCSLDSLACRSISGAENNDGVVDIVNLSSGELDMVEPRKEPFPQEFLQFVFDNSSRSDYFEASETSQTSLVSDSGHTGINNTSSAETLTGESPKQTGQTELENGT